jgi:hypothetical protein
MTFSTDVTAPTIISAVRDSDTQITVTLSEACQNLAILVGDGGFTVTKVGGTTYAVSATAQGGDSSHVVLTVADMGTAGAAGVIVTYTAGANGTIADTAGNALATDATGKTIAAWDTTAPTILTGTLSADNTFIDITLSEGIYGADDGTTALSAGKFALTFTQNGGTATNAVISSIKKNNNTAEGSASALVGGETTVRVFLTVTGTPNGLETIEIKPANGTSVYDKAGNAMLAAQTTGTKSLKDLTPPTLVSAVRTDDTHILVELSKNCVNITKNNDGGFAVSETGAPATQYAVSAIEQGADARHVVSTVANLGVSAKEGVTVTYLAGVNGTIEDTLGNSMSTDGAGVSIAAWDTAAPTVTGIERLNPSSEATNAATVIYRVTFGEAVTGVNTADFELTATNTASGTIFSVTAVSATEYDVTVNAISGDGTLRLDLKNSGTDITDIGGNAITTGYTGGAIYTIDRTAPTIMISSAVSSPTKNSPIAVTFTFSEDVTGFTEEI